MTFEKKYCWHAILINMNELFSVCFMLLCIFYYKKKSERLSWDNWVVKHQNYNHFVAKSFGNGYKKATVFR